jgi:hypothetical protein
MTKFTPGPWAPSLDRTNVWSKTGKVASVEPINLKADLKRYDEWFANAHLIAAAPELFEAAKAVLDDVPFGEKKDKLVLALLKACHGEDDGGAK